MPAGRTTLFAAFDVADGQVIGLLHRRRRAIEFQKFLSKIDRSVPAEQDVHLVYLEDVRPTVSFADRMRGLFASSRLLAEQKAEDPAAILFTSGSEGTP